MKSVGADVKRALALVLLLPAVGLGAAVAPDAKVVTIEGATVRLCTDCRPQRVTFPVTVVPGAGRVVLKKDERPRIVSASLGETRLPELQSGLTPSWEPATGPPKTLVLTIDPPLSHPGTYDIEIALLPKGRPGAPAETVHLVVGAATLEGPDKLLVHRTRGLRGWRPPHATPFVLFETGRLAGVEKLDVHPMTFVHDNEPLDAEVFSRTPPSPAAAPQAPDGVPAMTLKKGDSISIVYDISDRIPLGLTSGSVRVMAPEVTTALVIPVEIRSMLSREFLALAIILGLALSWLVKVVLHNRLLRSQARVAAATLLKDVQADRSIFPDATFQKATTRKLADLDAAVRTAATADIEEARKDLDTAWRAARLNFEKRRTDFRTELDGWQKLVVLPWELPGALRAILTAARGAGAAAATLDLNGDIDAANRSLDEAQVGVVLNLDQQGRHWRQASRTFFARLLAANAGISADITSALQTASDGWRGQFPIDPAPTNDPAQVQPLLRQITGEYGTAGNYLRELPHHLRREFEYVAGVLRAKGAGEAAIEDVRLALVTLEETLKSAVENPAIEAERVQPVLDVVQKAWVQAFTKAAPAADDVRKKVVARDYRGAADLLDPVPFAASGEAGPAARTSLVAGLASPLYAEGGWVGLGGVSAISPYQSLLLESAAEVRNTKFLQTLLVGGMFFVWAMSTSADTFDGTIRGLLAACFSAFSLDVGIDTLLGRIKGPALG